MTNSRRNGESGNLLSVVVVVLLLLGALAVWLILRRGEQGWMTAKPSAVGQRAGSAAVPNAVPSTSPAPTPDSGSSSGSLEVPGSATGGTEASGSLATPAPGCVAVDGESHSEEQPESAAVFSKAGTKVTTEVTARSVLGADAGHSCHIEWILHITPAQGDARQVRVSDGEDGGDEDNAFDIVGWSADGDRLLTAMASVQGDYEERVPVIYSLRTGKVWLVDMKRPLQKFMKRDCMLFDSPAGFTTDGRLIVDVESDEDLSPGEKPCIANGRWLVDYEHNTAALAQGKTTVIADKHAQ